MIRGGIMNKYIWKRNFVTAPIHKLICIPYAGTGASCFGRWQKIIGDKAEILPIQLPGRENRMDEQAKTDFSVVVDEISTAVLPFIENCDFSIFGHSLGGILTYEVAKHLISEHGLYPRWCFISASNIYQEHEKKYLSQLDDESFIEEIKKIGGVDDSVLSIPNMKKYFLNVVKNDFKLLDDHHLKGEKQLPVPIRTYFGTMDKLISPEQVATWKEYTSEHYSTKQYEGNHFFLTEYAGEICEDILEILKLDHGGAQK